jgi:hypothetical protein
MKRSYLFDRARFALAYRLSSLAYVRPVSEHNSSHPTGVGHRDLLLRTEWDILDFIGKGA